MCDAWVVLFSLHTPSPSRCLNLLARKSQVRRPAAHLLRMLAASKRSGKTHVIAHSSFMAHVTFTQFHNNCKDIDGTDSSVYYLLRERQRATESAENILISRHDHIDP
jgi:hypothetical protein